MATKKKIKLALIGTDLVFLASDPETNRTIGLRALEQGFRAIELAEVFNDREDVPLLVADVNDGDRGFAEFRLIAKKILKARSA